MKKLRMLKIATLSLMAFGMSAVGIAAQTPRATYWSYASYTSMPGGGTCLYKLTSEYQNIKTTSAATGSISGTISAALGGNSNIVNNVGSLRSDSASLTGSVLHPKLNDTAQGYGYYNRACTLGAEWGSSNNAQVYYSSDHID